jgi:hypothetical protein
MISDQFLAGTPVVMKLVLTMDSYPPNNGTHCRDGNAFWEWAGVDFPGGPESFIADFLYRRHIAWYQVSLQVARTPGDSEAPFNEGTFLGTPCKLCYDCIGGSPWAGLIDL